MFGGVKNFKGDKNIFRVSTNYYGYCNSVIPIIIIGYKRSRKKSNEQKRSSKNLGHIYKK